MAISLTAIGWWMHIDVPRTPTAVVVCVIIYNAAHGYRFVGCLYTWSITLHCTDKLGSSWGPLPWLYPPEVRLLPFITSTE